MITIDSARAQFDNQDLLATVVRLAGEGRQVAADLVALLAVLVERRLYAAEGYGTAHDFCVERLLLSDGQAYQRLAAARVAVRFPHVLEGLRNGRLSLTNVSLLARHLSDDNAEGILRWAEGRRKQEIERFLSGLAPLPDVAPSLRRLPASAAAALPVERAAERAPMEAGRTVAGGRAEAVRPGDAQPAPPPLGPTPTGPGPVASLDMTNMSLLRPQEAEPTARAVHVPDPAVQLLPGRSELRPLTPTRYSLRVTISEETERKLRQAQDLLGHAVPTADLAEVLDRALTALVEQLQRAKFAAQKRWPVPRDAPATGRRGGRRHSPQRTEQPQPHAGTASSPAKPPDTPTERQKRSTKPRSRYIPAAVRREVWRRDGARCTFVGPAGRCTRTRRLEFHHRVPFAEGGAATTDNIALACTIHNRWEAARWFGADVASLRSGASPTGTPKRADDFDQSKKRP